MRRCTVLVKDIIANVNCDVFDTIKTWLKWVWLGGSAQPALSWASRAAI